MTQSCVNCPHLPASDRVDWTSALAALVPVDAVADEADADAEDIRAIEHEHEVGPEPGEVAGLAVVEAEPEEHFQMPPAEPRYPRCEWNKLDRWKPKDWC